MKKSLILVTLLMILASQEIFSADNTLYITPGKGLTTKDGARGYFIGFTTKEQVEKAFGKPERQWTDAETNTILCDYRGKWGTEFVYDIGDKKIIRISVISKVYQTIKTNIRPGISYAELVGKLGKPERTFRTPTMLGHNDWLWVCYPGISFKVDTSTPEQIVVEIAVSAK